MIYVHIPFCRSFCTYCDFFSEVAAKCRGTEDVRRQDEMFSGFADALTSEIRSRSGEISDNTNTLYIGGGTPSVLPLSVFETILSALRETGHGGPFDEFTVEVNPEDIVDKGEDYVEGLMKLGVNRISMGVQSFDDSILKFMNRRHDAGTARKAYGILESAGMKNISIDLIFGLPQLSDRQWQDTLKEALDISPSGRLPQHISSYQLSVELGSMLAKLVERGKWSEASEDQCGRQYSMLCDALHDAGYNHYEISNFALPGYEAKHNSAYWNHVPYVGFGPAAHSFVIPSVGRSGRRWNASDLGKYIENPTGVWEKEDLTDGQMAMEKIMLSLRTAAGISEDYLLAHADPAAVRRAIDSGGLVRIEGGMVRIPEDKFFISDNIIAEII